MSDVSYKLKANVRRAAYDAVPGMGESCNIKSLVATKSVTARTANDTMKLVRLPSNARISGLSKVFWDDLASSGSPTLDLGIAPVDDTANAITAVPAALNDGLDVATAAGSAALIKDHANYGKMLWELLGLTADPLCSLDIYASFVDANTNVTGDVTLEVIFSFD